jgi:flagellar hook-associated protein 2
MHMASPILPGSGLGSGLDIGSIVTALVNSDKAAQQSQITKQTSITTAKISATGALKSVLAAFQTAMDGLNKADAPAFSGFAATSGTPATLTVTSDNTAVNGSYNVVVNNLASSSKIASAAFAGGASSAIPTGTLTVSQNGINYAVNIPSGATLQSTRDAINSTLQGKGITANIVTDANGSRLVVGSTVTGAGSDISLSGIAGLAVDGTTKMDGTATGAGYISALATDASFSVDGLAVTSKSNTVSPVGGISMNLLAGGGASSVVKVGTNSAGLQTSLQAFVDAYNKVITTLTSYTTPGLDADGKPTVSNALTGDSLPRNLISAVRNELVNVPSRAGAAGDPDGPESGHPEHRQHQVCRGDGGRDEWSGAVALQRQHGSDIAHERRYRALLPDRRYSGSAHFHAEQHTARLDQSAVGTGFTRQQPDRFADCQVQRHGLVGRTNEGHSL